MKAIELYKRENQRILITAVAFKTLRSVVKFTERVESNWDGSDQSDEENETVLEKYYQRPTNGKRVEGIKNYIKTTLFDESSKEEVLFPSALILGVDLNLETIFIKDEVVTFSLPDEKESCLIVDGQHRMKAMFKLHQELSAELEKNREALKNGNINNKLSIEFEENTKKLNKVNEYKFNCTILVNYDLWEQASIFASVNFNQKPVDRSLYYDIFGEPPLDYKDKTKSNLYIAHELGKYLNSSPKSPLNGFVQNFRKQEGFVSQSFLMQALLSHFGSRGTWREVTNDYKEDGDLYKKLPKVYVSYFNAIKKVLKDYWPASIDKEASTILTKTTGLSALIKLLGHINKNMELGLFPGYEETKLLDLNIEELTKIFENIFEKLIKNEENSNLSKAELLFGKNSKYAGSGSGGMQSQLFKELAEAIGIPV
ncbi:DGQHR domain-containing protein [Mangrovimonas sp. ST2L15]|uniref:DGQHR domain-containing protein n=1 Tax=Mangrovimonas sp. ST2L15 TaxID=1645916 RepID=UPI0006B41017|nr:DGQHR domain-containing protein [Mangrovimonas sp. ST2L15]